MSAATAEEFDWDSIAYLGEVPDLPEQWGLKSAQGVVSIAPTEQQAREWYSYHYPGPIGPVQERLVRRVGDGEWLDAVGAPQ